jgi:hypothetical protein
MALSHHRAKNDTQPMCDRLIEVSILRLAAGGAHCGKRGARPARPEGTRQAIDLHQGTRDGRA